MTILDHYMQRGLSDFRLQSLTDIKEIYGHDILSLKGYSDLSYDNKVLLQEFIVNFYNSLGMDNRLILKPIEVNYVEYQEYGIPLPPEEDLKDRYDLVATVIKRRSATGKYVNFKKHLYEDNVDLKICKAFPVEYFLRIDYKWGSRREWLHITGPRKWY